MFAFYLINNGREEGDLQITVTRYIWAEAVRNTFRLAAESGSVEEARLYIVENELYPLVSCRFYTYFQWYRTYQRSAKTSVSRLLMYWISALRSIQYSYVSWLRGTCSAGTATHARCKMPCIAKRDVRGLAASAKLQPIPMGFNGGQWHLRVASGDFKFEENILPTAITVRIKRFSIHYWDRKWSIKMTKWSSLHSDFGDIYIDTGTAAVDFRCEVLFKIPNISEILELVQVVRICFP